MAALYGSTLPFQGTEGSQVLGAPPSSLALNRFGQQIQSRYGRTCSHSAVFLR